MKPPTHLSQLGIPPELFEAMAANSQSDHNKVKINKKAIRKELKARQRKNVEKDLR